MTANEYFKRIDELNTTIQIKREQIESLRNALSISTVPTDALYVSHTRNVTAMEGMIAAIIDFEKEAACMKNELNKLKQRLVMYIRQIPNPQEAALITERYIEGLDTKAIAKNHHYSRRRIQQLLKIGAEHFDVYLSEGAIISPGFAN